MQEVLRNPEHWADFGEASQVAAAAQEEELSTGREGIPILATPAVSGVGHKPVSRDWRASLISFGIALSLHAALIAIGLLYYKSASQYQPPQLVLPKGWATEFDGSGDAGVPPLLSQVAAPLDLPKPDAPAPQPHRLTPLYNELEPATAPPVTIDASRGTATDVGPLPDLSGDTSAPPVNFHAAPGRTDTSSSESSGSAPTVTSTVAQPLADAVQAGHGSASAGQGRGEGGGRQGVPNGQPIPSSRNKHPTYPDIALRNGWTGTAYLELDLDQRGRVTDVRLVQSSGYGVLDQAAVEKARTWTFSPATLDGRPVLTTVPVRVPFTLNSNDP